MRNIVYISGSGRSGSTLLERTLNSSDDFFALGEFHCLWRLPTDALTCSCGMAFSADPFWQDILDRARITDRELAELRRLEEEICRTPFLARSGYSLETVRKDERVQRFLALQLPIFEAIFAATGTSILVDSSKAGPRAWLLACDPRVRILHLYREPGDVIASWRSKKFDKGLNGDMQRLSVLHAAMDWAKVEYLIKKLAEQAPIAKVDYRRFCETPDVVIADALNSLLEIETKPFNWLDERRFMPAPHYHSLNGNPDRFSSGPVHIAARTLDRSRLPPLDRLAITAAQAALSALYPSPARRTSP
jgi:hypothetical protein